MGKWIDILKNPIGLAGYALFLVFTLLSQKKYRPKWLMAIFIIMAILSLIGGLFLAWINVQLTSNTDTESDTIVHQSSFGNDSPPINDVEGDVVIIRQYQKKGVDE